MTATDVHPAALPVPSVRARRVHAFCALSTAASRSVDARYAAAGTAPGSPAHVHRADLLTDLADRRVAHTLALAERPDGTVQYGPDDVQRDGLLTFETTMRLHKEGARR